MVLPMVLSPAPSVLPAWLRAEIERELDARLGFMRQRFKTPCVVGNIDVPHALDSGDSDYTKDHTHEAPDAILGMLDVGMQATLAHIRQSIARLAEGGMILAACLAHGTLHPQRLALIESALVCGNKSNTLFPTLPTAHHVIDTLRESCVTLPVVDGEAWTHTYSSHAALMRDCAPLLGIACPEKQYARAYMRIGASIPDLRCARVMVLWVHGWKQVTLYLAPRP